MTAADVLPASVLRRRAVVYVRQSSQSQVQAIETASRHRSTSVYAEWSKAAMTAFALAMMPIARLQAVRTLAKPGMPRRWAR